MLRSLWKLQWKQFAARMKKGNGKKTSGGWLVFLMLFLVVCMEIWMFVVFAELVPLCGMGLTWLYFAMAGTMALALSMLGSVFMTQAQLYDAKDNELLLSMPIPPKYILLTRIAMLFTTTAGYTLAVLLPAFGIYAFSSVSTSGAKAGAKHKSGKASAKQRTPVLSVAHKEQRKFFTSPAYLMNFGFGLVVIPVLPIAAAIFRGKLMQMISLMGFRPEWIALGIFGVMAFCIATSCATAPSVSLEGKNLWVLRTMPISGKTVLLGKLLMVCRLQMPLVAVSVLALCLIAGCGIGLTVLTVCVCALFCWFVGTFGLVMNLLAPRFDWQSENQPCKQSLSVFVTMFGAYFFAAVIVGVFFAVSALHIPGIAAYAVTTAFLLLASALMYLLLVHWGAKKFECLEA